MNKIIYKQAFTLIEVLVGVLIIAILTAVAVPMYKRAVLKSRFSTVMPMAKAIAQSNEVYYLNNGEYTDKLAELDVENLPEQTAGVLAGLKSTEYYDYVLTTREGLNNNYIIYQAHSKNFPDNIHCEAKTGDENANNVCKSLDGVQIGGSQTDGYTTYILRGNVSDGHFPIVYNGDSNLSIELTEMDTCKTRGQHSCEENIYDGGTCLAEDHNACWKGTHKNGSLCDATDKAGSCYYAFFDNDSECRGKSTTSCNGGTFTNKSTCVAEGAYVCGRSWFTDSTCVGKAPDSCGANSNGLISKFTNSICYGENTNACSNSTYTNNSKCMMNNETACQNNTYESGACCQAAAGFTCPEGTACNGN